MSARFYAVVGLPRPGSDPHRVTVAPGDLPRFRGRLLAAGATVIDTTPTSLLFHDPDGVRVELVGS